MGNGERRKGETGGCLCGAVRFEIDRDGVISAHHCHCRDCQRTTGSASTTFLIVPEASFSSLQGEPNYFTVTGTAGSEVKRGFCGNCGCPLYSEVSVMPGVKFVKAGALDAPSWVRPVSSFWTGSAQPWGHVDDSLDSFEANPPM